MKKALDNIFRFFGLLSIALCLLFFVCFVLLVFAPLGEVVFSLLFGAHNTKL